MNGEERQTNLILPGDTAMLISGALLKVVQRKQFLSYQEATF